MAIVVEQDKQTYKDCQVTRFFSAPLPSFITSSNPTTATFFYSILKSNYHHQNAIQDPTLHRLHGSLRPDRTCRKSPSIPILPNLPVLPNLLANAPLVQPRPVSLPNTHPIPIFSREAGTHRIVLGTAAGEEKTTASAAARTSIAHPIPATQPHTKAISAATVVLLLPSVMPTAARSAARLESLVLERKLLWCVSLPLAVTTTIWKNWE